MARAPTVQPPPIPLRPWGSVMFDREQPTQKAELLPCLNIMAPAQIARNAAVLEIPRVSSIGATSAPVVETMSKTETANDKAQLKEAQKIDEQIEEITVFLMSLEIV